MDIGKYSKWGPHALGLCLPAYHELLLLLLLCYIQVCFFISSSIPLGNMRKSEKIGVAKASLNLKFSLPVIAEMLLFTTIYVQASWVLHVVYHTGHLTTLSAPSEIQK